METYKIKDALDNCVIRLHRFGRRTPGGLYRPNAEKRKNMIGRVEHVGSVFQPKDYKGYRVKVGDEIIFKNWNVLTAAPWAGENLQMVKWEDVIGVVIR
jgi:co-chaperonin GroES (HSP10)